MPFVKLDCGILNSTLWFDKAARDVFVTALLMAEPFELSEPTPQIAVDSLENTGWMVPPGWYGFVPAAGVGIVHRSGADETEGYEALKRLGEPEESSRTPDFDGRRMVRISGGYLILNYIKYRERDYTSAERSRRYRERVASRRDIAASRRDITQAEVQAEEQAERAQKNAATTATQPTGAQAPGPLAGTLPRDHLTHAFCGTRFCVSASHFSKLARAYGDDGPAVLTAWLQGFDRGLTGGYGGPVWLAQHWDAHLVTIGRVAPAPTPKTGKTSPVQELRAKLASEGKLQ